MPSFVKSAARDCDGLEGKNQSLRLLEAQLTFINSVQSVICEIFLLHWIGCDWKLLVRKALTIKNLDGVDQQKVMSAIEGCNFRDPIVIDAERYLMHDDVEYKANTGAFRHLKNY